MHGAQLRPGFHAQRFDELAPPVLVHRQRLGPPPGPVQRQHEQAAEPFPQRVCPDQRDQVADQILVTAEVKFQADVLLGDQQPPFLQAGGLDLGERPVDAAQRGAAPQRARPARSSLAASSRSPAASASWACLARSSKHLASSQPPATR